MEDSGKVQTEENKVSLDVNKKRTVKTPEQIMALEKFYKEYKFPSDEIKEQMAVQVGLTEKQISSWFCHRRLKDKKRDEYANGRLDHSSGVIQDRGSGLRQDSSGSVKERDYRNIDPREVESGRISSADHVYVRRRHQNPYDAHMEDTTSESSSSLQDMHFSGSRDPYDMTTSGKIKQNGAMLLINSRTTKNKVYKPSGYLKVKGESENPAITAVKRQLGRYYLEDGPILCIEFDSLPSSAFEFPSSNSISAEPVDVGDHEQPRSHISGVIKQPNLNIITVHNSKMRSQDSYMDNATFKTMHGSERRNKKPRHQLKYKSSFLCSNSYPGQNSSSDIHKGSAEKAGITDSKQSRMRLDSSNHTGHNGRRIDNERENPCLRDDDNHIYKAPKNKNPSKISNSVRGCIESLDTERKPSPRMGKAEKLGGEWKPKMEYPVRVKSDPENESRVAKQVNVEFPQQDFVLNASSHARSSLLTNPTKRSSMDVPASLSEDETAETSSSSDC